MFNKTEIYSIINYLYLGFLGLHHILVYGLVDNYGPVTDPVILFLYFIGAFNASVMALLELNKMISEGENRWIMIFHHVLVIVCNIATMLTSEYKLGIIMYTTELSSPFLVLRNKMKKKNIKGFKFASVNVLFALLFISIRMIIAPISIMHNLLFNIPYYMYFGTISITHYIVSFSSIMLLLMNFYWGKLVIKGIIKIFIP